MSDKPKYLGLLSLILAAAALVIMALPFSQELRYLPHPGKDFIIHPRSYFSFFAFAAGNIFALPTALFTLVLFVVMLVKFIRHKQIGGLSVIALSVFGFVFSLSYVVIFYGSETIWSWVICIMLALCLIIVCLSTLMCRVSKNCS